MNRRKHRKFLMAAVALLATVPFIVSAETGLKIQPVKISETLNPGRSVSGEIFLTNVSSSAVTITVSAQDFVPLAGADTIQFVGRALGVTSVRDWITVNAPAQFRLAKDQARTIGYTIVAPANAEPGGHFGVIFFKAVTPGTGNQLNVGTQVGMLVLVSIPGKSLESGRIIDFTTAPFIQHGPVSFFMHFENTGTVHYEPRGEIKISDMLGRTVGVVPIQGEVVLPTSIKKMEFDWNVSGFLFGRYTAVATVRDGDGNALTSAAATFWVVPVWYIVAFLATLIALFFIIRFVKRRVKISISLD